MNGILKYFPTSVSVCDFLKFVVTDDDFRFANKTSFRKKIKIPDFSSSSVEEDTWQFGNFPQHIFQAS